ncbi:MAG: FapA family protein, partial [Lachnospiraceae bacterium]|nr:FapA family protein [Lachnospiraceae bacterium]
EGKKGFISGGVIRSTTMVTARTIGSNMGATTVIEVGIDPKIVEEYHDLSKELLENQEQTEQLTVLLTSLAKRLKLEGKLPPDKLLQFKHENSNREALISRAAQITERIESLKQTIDSYQGGVVRAKGNVYSGCKITVSNAVYYVKDEIAFVRFEKEAGEVKCNSYY